MREREATVRGGLIGVAVSASLGALIMWAQMPQRGGYEMRGPRWERSTAVQGMWVLLYDGGHLAAVIVEDRGGLSYRLSTPYGSLHGLVTGKTLGEVMDEVEDTLRDAGFQRFPVIRPAI